MALLDKPFNPLEVTPSQGFLTLPLSGPEGIPAVIVEDEIKATKANDGGYIKFVFEITEGETKGARGFWNLNLYNNNEKTCAIAQSQLSSIAYCVGVMQSFTDTGILHNRPLRILTRLQKKDKPEDPDRVEIYGVLDSEGNRPGKAGPGHAEMPQGLHQANNNPPFPAAAHASQPSFPSWQTNTPVSAEPAQAASTVKLPWQK